MIPFSVYTFGTIDDLVVDTYTVIKGITAMAFNSGVCEAIISGPVEEK